MKLSEVRGERTLDVIADCFEPIANIAMDTEAAALFRREKLPPGLTAKEFLLERAKKSVPVLLKEHKGDLVTILSSIEGVTGAEYLETLTLAKLIKDTIELLTDEVFLEVFISPQSVKDGTSSGSASENTEAQESV